MDPATSAALIGAGVGAGSTLAAQLLTHQLGLNRERRSQVRTRRLAAVEKAALSLAKSESESDRASDAHPESVLGKHPEILPLVEGIGEAVAVLQVHFGTDHPIVKSYTATWAICAQAKVDLERGLKTARDRLRASGRPPTLDAVQQAAGEEIEASARSINKALVARDLWTEEALRAARKP